MPLPTLSETKHFLRVDHNEDDGLISSLLITSKTLIVMTMITILEEESLASVSVSRIKISI